MPPSDWRTQLQLVDDLMKAVSLETDAQSLVRTYAKGVRALFHSDNVVSISRRDLDAPWYRITRSRRWEHEINPWQQRDQLPILSGGLFGEWLYEGKAQFIEHFDVDEDDPGYFHLKDLHAAFVMPQYDLGQAVNMTVLFWENASGVDVNQIPNAHWQGNLFGRTTHNLVLRQQLATAYQELDRELQVVGAMQRSLLPQELPDIDGYELAAEYRTSARAGGDLYDLFPLPNGCWGLFIADVSGHGVPAAVIMAITHALAHAHPGPPNPPGEVLAFLNRKLTIEYTSRTPSFVTAFYAVLDPKTRTLRYSSAGHPPPRLVRAGSESNTSASMDPIVHALDGQRGLPLGIMADEHYHDSTVQLHRGDHLLMYTDGLSEAFNPKNQLFGFERLDETLRAWSAAQATSDHQASMAREVIDAVLNAVAAFAEGRPPNDDQTMLALRVK